MKYSEIREFFRKNEQEAVLSALNEKKDHDLLTDKQYRDFFTCAAEFGYIDVIEKMMERGFDVHSVNSFGYAALEVAIIFNKNSSVNFLSSRISDEELKERYAHCVITMVDQWSSKKDEEIDTTLLERLINTGVDLSVEDDEGCSLLELAIPGKSKKIINLLLSVISDKEIRNPRNLEFLREVGYTEHHELLEKMAEAGCDLNSLDSYKLKNLLATLSNQNAGIILAKSMAFRNEGFEEVRRNWDQAPLRDHRNKLMALRLLSFLSTKGVSLKEVEEVILGPDVGGGY